MHKPNKIKPQYKALWFIHTHIHTHTHTHTHRYPAPPAVSLSMAHLPSRSDSVSCEIENGDVEHYSEHSRLQTAINTPLSSGLLRWINMCYLTFCSVHDSKHFKAVPCKEQKLSLWNMVWWNVVTNKAFQENTIKLSNEATQVWISLFFSHEVVNQPPAVVWGHGSSVSIHKYVLAQARQLQELSDPGLLYQLVHSYFASELTGWIPAQILTHTQHNGTRPAGKTG